MTKISICLIGLPSHHQRHVSRATLLWCAIEFFARGEEKNCVEPKLRSIRELSILGDFRPPREIISNRVATRALRCESSSRGEGLFRFKSHRSVQHHHHRPWLIQDAFIYQMQSKCRAIVALLNVTIVSQRRRSVVVVVQVVDVVVAQRMQFLLLAAAAVTLPTVAGWLAINY